MKMAKTFFTSGAIALVGNVQPWIFDLTWSIGPYLHNKPAVILSLNRNGLIPISSLKLPVISRRGKKT